MLEILEYCHDDFVEDMHHLTLSQDSQQSLDVVNHEDIGLEYNVLEYNAWSDHAKAYEYDVSNAYDHAEVYEDAYAGDEDLAFPYDPGDYGCTHGYDYGDLSSYPFDPGGREPLLYGCFFVTDHHCYVRVPLDPF